MHHKLRSLSGMKIFAFIRIIGLFNFLLNSFNKDFDVQLISMFRQSKVRNKIISFIIILMSLFLNIVTYWSYMIALSIALNDSNNNFIYAIFLKLNFIDIKKAGKSQKKKKLMDVIYKGIILITVELNDRFFLIFCLNIVTVQNYFDNKLNSHNFLDYITRIVFIIALDILVCWIKIILMFKFSNVKASFLKSVFTEYSIFYEKLRHGCFSINGKNEDQYLKKLEDYELVYVNKSNFHKFLGYLDYDCIIYLEFRNNILVPCIIVSSPHNHRSCRSLSISLLLRYGGSH
jgi:hypothetical protein